MLFTAGTYQTRRIARPLRPLEISGKKKNLQFAENSRYILRK